MFQVAVFCFDRNQYIACRTFEKWEGAHAYYLTLAAKLAVNTSISITDYPVV